MKRILMGLAMMVGLVNFSLAGQLINVEENTRIAIEGYDPVAFFTEGEAIKGSSEITAEHDGAVYHFASQGHLRAFVQDPGKYVPAFGGFCAFGASVGKVFPVEIDTWQVKYGRLFFQKDQEVRKLFEENPDENFRKAEQNWPDLVKEHGK